MQYILDITSTAKEDLSNLERHVAQRIVKKLRFYADSPDPVKFSEPLKDSDKGRFRFHVGSYRATFDIERTDANTCIMHILYVDDRKDVYKKKK